jgi:hypothetical protein
MKMTAARTPARQRYINALAFRSSRLDMVLERRVSLFDLGGYVGFNLLHKLSEGCPLLNRDLPDCLLGRREGALLTQITRSQVRKRALLGLRLAKTQGGHPRRVVRKGGKALELLLERFACSFNESFRVVLTVRHQP